MRNKICHISTVHDPFDVRIFHKECVTLSESNDVHLIANHSKKEIVNNVTIWPIGNEPTNRFQRIFKFVNSAFKIAIQLDADVYHIHDPELLRIAKKLKKKKKIVIYDAHEDLPRQILTKHWIPKILRRLIAFFVERYENKVVRKMDGIVTATNEIKNRFTKENPNTVNVNNFPILNEFKSKADLLSNSKDPHLVYSGGIAKQRGIYELISCLEESDIKLNLAGKYLDPSLEVELKKLKGWKKVIDHGFVSRLEIANIYQSSIAGLVTLYPTKNYKTSMPVKMFEYMAAGLPVIASNFPLWESIINKHNCGICVNPYSAIEIKNAINEIIENPEKAKEMGDNGRKIAFDKYNWDNEGEKLVKLYQQF